MKKHIALAIIIILLGIIVIIATLAIKPPQMKCIVSADSAVFCIAFIENVSIIVVSRFHEIGVKTCDNYLQTIIRVAGYLVVIVASISILAADPTLAISIGTLSGIVIGFASQNVIANILATGLLVITRVIKVGDKITIAGNSGQIADVTPLFTILDTPTGTVYVPNSLMVSNVIQALKTPTGKS